MDIRILHTREDIAAAVLRTAARIRQRFGDREPVTVLVLLKGALWFAADLLRELPENYLLETVRVSSYHGGLKSSGELVWRTPSPDVKHKRVLVVDDILDTGATLSSVVAHLRRCGAEEIACAVAVDKRGGRTIPFQADFAALTADTGFLVGYGMDYQDRYRNLPYIGELQL